MHAGLQVDRALLHLGKAVHAADEPGDVGFSCERDAWRWGQGKLVAWLLLREGWLLLLLLGGLPGGLLLKKLLLEELLPLEELLLLELLLALKLEKLLAMRLLLLLVVVLLPLQLLLQLKAGCDARQAAAASLEAGDGAGEEGVAGEGVVELLVELLGVN